MRELFAHPCAGYALRMDGMSETTFAENFRRRTKELRMNRGFTQQEVAQFLGIEYEAYKKYENRSILPQFLMARFCKLVGCELVDLFRPPMLPPQPPRGRPPKHGKH